MIGRDEITTELAMTGAAQKWLRYQPSPPTPKRLLKELGMEATGI
jgi:hypothetical protein